MNDEQKRTVTRFRWRPFAIALLATLALLACVAVTVDSVETDAATLEVNVTAYPIYVSASPEEGGDALGGAVYSLGDDVTLMASPNASYEFVNWTKDGKAVSYNQEYSFIVYEETAGEYVANFKAETYKIIVTRTPIDWGIAYGSGEYIVGETATISVKPSPGYELVNWTRDGVEVSKESSFQFVVSEDTAGTYIAHLRVKQYTINVNVEASPAEGGKVSGGGEYPENKSVKLDATPNYGYEFVNWTKDGKAVSTYQSYVFIASKATEGTYVANFKEITYTIRAEASPEAGGSVSGGGDYKQGAIATLSAKPSPGYEFVNWTMGGKAVSQDSSFKIVASPSTAGTYVANFKECIYTITYDGNGNTGGEAPVDKKQYRYGDEAKICYPGDLSKNGYDFTGWATNSAGTGTEYPAGATIIVQGDLHLYACWEPHIYQIDVKSASPSSYGDVKGGGKIAGGQSVTIYAVCHIGYHFVNWTRDGVVVSESDCYTFTVDDSTASRDGPTIYIGLFEPDIAYVTYDGNGSTGGKAPVDGTAYDPKSTVTVLGNTGDLVKKGYYFDGWNTKADGSGTTYQPGDTFVIERSTTLYALWIQQKEVTVTANNVSKTYGHADPTLTCTITGLPKGETVEYRLYREPGEDVGIYTIRCTGEADQGKYHVTFVNGKFFIDEKRVYVTADDKSKFYGDRDPELTATVKGLLEGDTVYYALERVAGEDVGAYKINATGRSYQGNYIVTFNSGELTIDPKTVTVTADDKSKIYGEVDPVLTATVSGTLGSDAVTYELEREPGENPGVYEITAFGDSEQGNYAVTFVPGTFTIEPDPNVIIVAADDKYSVYGEDEQELTVTIIGKGDLPELSYTISRDAGKDVGLYKITVTGDSEQGGYRIQFVDGIYVIRHREAVVAAEPSYKVVGTDDPEFKAVEFGLLPGDTIEYTLAREMGEDIRAYGLFAIGEEVQGNYLVAYRDSEFAITSEPTVVVIDDTVIETTEDSYTEGDVEITIFTEKLSSDDGSSTEALSITKKTDTAGGKITYTNYMATVINAYGDKTVTINRIIMYDDPSEYVTEFHKIVIGPDGHAHHSEKLQSLSKGDSPITVVASVDSAHKHAIVNANLDYITDDGTPVFKQDIDDAIERIERLTGAKEWYSEALLSISITCSDNAAVAIEQDAFSRMTERDMSLYIISNKGSMHYDAAVVERMSHEYSEVYLSMELSNEDSLTPEQRKAMPERATFAVVLAGSEGVEIHDLGGTATVTFPFDNYGGWEIVNVFYMDDSGLSFPVPGAYYDPLNGMVYLETDHHSVFYAVGSNPSEVTDVVVTINQTEDFLSIILIADAGTVPHGTITVDIAYAEYDEDLQLYVAGHETKDLRVEYDGYQAVTASTILSDMEHFAEAFNISATYLSDPVDDRVIVSVSEKIQPSSEPMSSVLAFATNDENSISCAIAPNGTHVLPAGTITFTVAYYYYDYELELYTVGYQTSGPLKTPSGEDIIYTDSIDIEWVEYPDSIFWYVVNFVSDDGLVEVHSNKTLFGYWL